MEGERRGDTRWRLASVRLAAKVRQVDVNARISLSSWLLSSWCLWVFFCCKKGERTNGEVCGKVVTASYLL
jgi:hypothetical protein